MRFTGKRESLTKRLRLMQKCLNQRRIFSVEWHSSCQTNLQVGRHCPYIKYESVRLVVVADESLRTGLCLALGTHHLRPMLTRGISPSPGSMFLQSDRTPLREAQCTNNPLDTRWTEMFFCEQALFPTEIHSDQSMLRPTLRNSMTLPPVYSHPAATLA